MMRKRFLGMSMLGVSVLLLVSAVTVMAQRTRNRPAAPPPARTDLKITYRTTTSGQPMETTTMLKGARERSEMKLGYGQDMINVTQCDLKRTIQISDNARKYVITPMETGEVTASTGQVAHPVVEPSRAGGVVTYTSTAIDTGERKEMFGFQARHVKTSLTIESSPDACSPMKMRMETDGWYIDASFGLTCDVGRTGMGGGMSARGGCRDTVRFKRVGAARTGYALQETTTSYGPNGTVSFTSTKEVIELSREPLDAALFDIPAGYAEAASTQELYAMPSMGAMSSPMANGRSSGGRGEDRSSNLGNTKQPGSVRVGVVQINNRTDHGVSQDALRGRLIGELQGDNVEAVPLNAISPREAETEAKAKQCDFILYTDLTALKTSAAKKVGGFLGRATGIGSGGVDKTEAKVEFQLFAVGETAPRLKSAATAKEEGDEATVGNALDQEARQVSAAAKRKQ